MVDFQNFEGFRSVEGYTSDYFIIQSAASNDESEKIKYNTGIWGKILAFFGLAEAHTFSGAKGVNGDVTKGISERRTPKDFTVYIRASDAKRWIKKQDPEGKEPVLGELYNRMDACRGKAGFHAEL